MSKTEVFGECCWADKRLLDTYKDEYLDHIKIEMEAKLADCIFTQIEDGGEKIVSLLDISTRESKDVYGVEYRRYIIFEDLVRCKDCKYYEQTDDDYEGEQGEDSWGVCRNTGAGMMRCGYCSDGERKDDADNR